MNDDELPPPLPASAQALLRSERGRPGIPDSARLRIAHRLEWAVGATTAADLESVDAAFPSWRTRWAFLGQAFRAAVASVAVLGPVPLAAAGVGAASVVGLGIRALIVAHREPSSRPTPRVVGSAATAHPPPYVVAPLPDLPTLPSSPMTIPPSEPIPVAPPAARVAKPALPSAPAAVVQPPRPMGDREVPPPTLAPAVLPPHQPMPLAAEGVLLDRARTALNRKNPAEALERIAEHRMNYPESQLAEEREFLSVEAELAAGNVGEARFRAEEFQRRFPHSLLLPRVQAALAKLR